MTWAISPVRRRPGELLTRGDVCHFHYSREEAEQCGVEHAGVPELVRLERRSERVYRVVWSLSDTSGGALRRPARRRLVGTCARRLWLRSPDCRPVDMKERSFRMTRQSDDVTEHPHSSVDPQTRQQESEHYRPVQRVAQCAGMVDYQPRQSEHGGGG